MTKAKKPNDFAANLIGYYLLPVIMLVIGIALVVAGLFIWHPLVIIGAILIFLGLFLIGV